MQKISLCHHSSLMLIRQLRIAGQQDLFLRETLNIKLDMSIFGSSPHVLVRNTNKFHSNKSFKYHLQSKHLPKHSILSINENIKCVRPELMLLQLANTLESECLMQLIMEFCGQYAYDNNFCAHLGTAPVTSIEKIKKYIQRYHKLNKYSHGYKKLSYALNFCDDNAASPMETRLYLLLAGPRKLGMYGCKNLKLNIHVQLDAKSAKIAGQHTIILDISCKTAKVGVEYDSRQFHENEFQGQKDKRRRDALTSKGWKIFTIVPAQINNPYTFDVIARQILKALGQDYRLRNKNFIEKRNTTSWKFRNNNFIV